MCLRIASNAVEKVAEADIICYKVLKSWRVWKFEFLTSPFRGKWYRLGRTYTAKLQRSMDIFQKHEVNNGLHSFGEAYAASIPLGKSEGVYTAIIPKGSKYYTGRFGGCVSYASNALIVTEEVVYS